MGRNSTTSEMLSLKDKYQYARIIRTTKDTSERITETGVLEMSHKTTEDAPSIRVNPGNQYQSILGFGGAFTEAGGYVLSKISPEKQQEIINAYFSADNGLNYNLCRVHMNSCDFCLGNYSCDDTPGDIELKNFNIDHDKIFLIPFIKSAVNTAKSSIRLLVTPWSPPAWMKTNGNMNLGGKLKPEYSETWALFFSKFIQAYEQEEIAVWGVSVQNEPLAAQTWDSCLYTAEEEGNFVRDHLGPRLQKDGHGAKKIIIWDHNRDLLYDRAKLILSDQETAKYVWGVGFHWYVSNQFENIVRTSNEFPDKPLIFTEGSIENGVKLGQWDRGEIYAHNMIRDLNSGTAGWIDWNMVLDQTGGPNHAKNYCDASVIVNLDTREIHYQSSYYYIGHFSKYISVGAKRIDCLSDNVLLETAAFVNPDGKITVVILNRKDEDIPFELKLKEDSVTVISFKHSIQTIIIE
jgi:glucosylceramidase